MAAGWGVMFVTQKTVSVADAAGDIGYRASERLAHNITGETEATITSVTERIRWSFSAVMQTITVSFCLLVVTAVAVCRKKILRMQPATPPKKVSNQLGAQRIVRVAIYHRLNCRSDLL